jgi:hypothetical protein
MPALIIATLLTLAASPARSARPLNAVLDASGNIAVWDGARKVLDIHPGLALEGWQGLKVKSRAPLEEQYGEELILEDGGKVVIVLEASDHKGILRYTYTARTTSTLSMESIHASINTDIDNWLEVPYAVGGIKGSVPRDFREVHLTSSVTGSMELGPAPALGGLTFRLATDSPAPFLVQDSRQWWPSLELRVSTGRKPPWAWAPGDTVRFKLALSANRPIVLLEPREVTLKAGHDWVAYVPAY